MSYAEKLLSTPTDPAQNRKRKVTEMSATSVSNRLSEACLDGVGQSIGKAINLLDNSGAVDEGSNSNKKRLTYPLHSICNCFLQ